MQNRLGLLNASHSKLPILSVLQVEDVDRKFARLEQLQAAGWQDTVATAPAAPAPAPAARARKPPAPAARRPAVKKAGPSAALRAAMLGKESV